MLLCQCTIPLNTAKITEKQQAVRRNITEINQIILFLLILNLLNTRRVLQEILVDVCAGEAGYDTDKVGRNETEIVVPLKHLSNFWRTLNIPLINCEIELILTWSKNCALVDITVKAAGNNNDPPVIVAPT